MDNQKSQSLPSLVLLGHLIFWHCNHDTFIRQYNIKFTIQKICEKMIHSFITQYNANFTRQNMKQSWISCCCQETADPRVLCIDLRGNSQELHTGLEQSVSKKLAKFPGSRIKLNFLHKWGNEIFATFVSITSDWSPSSCLHWNYRTIIT